MPRYTQIFLAIVAASGVVFALMVGRWPTLERSVVPPFFWPLFVALVLDLITRPATQAGRMADVGMNMRFLGVIAGAVLYQATRFLLPTI